MDFPSPEPQTKYNSVLMSCSVSGFLLQQQNADSDSRLLRHLPFSLLAHLQAHLYRQILRSTRLVGGEEIRLQTAPCDSCCPPGHRRLLIVWPQALFMPQAPVDQKPLWTRQPVEQSTQVLLSGTGLH